MKKTAIHRRVSIRRTSGVTLIEIMAVVAIVGILSAIAIPSYEQFIDKARRTEAKGALLDLASRLEAYYADNQAYTGADVDALVGSSTTEKGLYTLSITSLTAQAYTIRATPTAQISDEPCGKFTLTSLGAKGVEDGSLSSSKCW
jgi:type IV pilus assembly protein PilE